MQPVRSNILPRSNLICVSVVLFCVDWVFLMLYLIEFGLRLGGHGQEYFPRSFWGLADFVIIVMGLVSSMSVIATQQAFEGTEKCNQLEGKA